MKEEIDYNSKILNFLAMTDTSDQELAVKYLESSDWDEVKAVNQFFNQINHNTYNNNALTNDSIIQNNNILNASQRSTNELITENNNNNNPSNIRPNQNNKNKKESFIYKYLFKLPYNFILDCCTENREVSRETEKKLFRVLPNLMDDFVEFCHLIKRKIGIIIFYNKNSLNFLNNLIMQLSRSTNCMNLMKNNFLIYPILANSRDGNKIQELIIDDNNNEILSPSFIFCFKKQNDRNNNYLNPILNKTHVVYTLEGDSININSFYEALKQICDKYLLTKINDIKSKDSLDKSFGLLTDGEILYQQKYEMEELEKKARMEEEQNTKEKMEQESIEKEIKNKAKDALEKIVEEPDKDNPEATTICFRYPDGETTKNRRFLKSHKIQNLYDYVTSLGEEIYTEKQNKNFTLHQPFPPKIYDNMEYTLEQEGLYPNALIQIKED